MQIHRKNSSSLIDKLIKWAGFVLLISSTTLPSIETVPICYGKVDIVFAIDASYSIIDQNFDTVREFLLNLCSKLQVDLGNELRAGLIFYATFPYTGEYMVGLADDQRKITNLLQTFERVNNNIKTYTGAALGVAHDMFENDARDDAYKILVLITDGVADDREVAYANADRIKALEVHVVAIGIGFDGEKVNRGELTYIGSVDSVYIVTSVTADFMKDVQMNICGQTLASKGPPTVIKDDVKMDLYFLLDEAMLTEDFEITKRFMKNIIQTFVVEPGKARVSVYLYGSTIGQFFVISTYTTEATLFNAIDNLALNSNNKNDRNVVSMFSILQNQITNSGTTGPVIAVLFVTGSVDSSAEAIQAAKLFRESANPSVYLITLGIGTNTPLLTSEQNRLAYDTGSAFQAENFLSLSGNNQESQEFVNSIRNTIFQLAKGTYVRQGTDMSYRWTSLFDVVFMVDGSAKMSTYIYYPVVKFVIKHLIDQFELGPDAARVAVLVYDAVGVYNVIRFDTYNHNHDTLFDKIDNLQLIQREDLVDNAVGLAGMLKYFLDNKREPAGSKLGYLITLGQTRNKLLAEAEARALAMEGIQLLTIGISPGVSESELNSYQMFDSVDGPTIISRIETLASSELLQEMNADLLKYAQISRPRGLIYQWDDTFDLVVLVHDESGRLDGGASARNFLIDLFHRYEIATDKVQGGVISFGLTTQDQIILGSDPFYTALYLKLLNLDLTPTGGSDVLAGLDALLNMFKTHGRPNVPKVALLLMQGDVDLDSVRAKIQEIRDEDIAIATVGIGAGTDMVDLQYIANHKELAFLETNWQALQVTPTLDASIIALARGSFKAQGTGDILRLPTQCTGEDVGIIFVLDASNSFQAIFEDVKKFAAALMSGFTAPVEIGALAYANIVLTNFITPGEYMSFVELYAHFMANINLDPNLKTTSTHLALQKMREMFSQKNPPYKEKVAIIITDGKSVSAVDTRDEAQRARDDGIKMIALSFLDDTFEDELDYITGEEITGGVNHKFLYSNSDLTNPSKLEAVQKLICALIRPDECLAGSYRDPISLECLVCPVGSFQALSEQLFCQKCALGYSTTDPGATRSSDCIKKCNAGYFLESAPNGKCKICPVGTYQPNSGQIQCLTCSPSTLTTKFEGSTSIDDCILDKCDVPMDLIFVVDSTASIGVFEFQMLKAFLINQLDRFDFTTTRISVVRIGAVTQAEDVTDFLTDKNLVIQAIRNLKGGDYSTNIASAIEMANDKFANDYREDVAQVMFLVTDGIASNPYAARYQALVAQQTRQLVVLGIGTQYFLHELRELASVPDTVLTEANFIKLASLDAYLTICDAAKRWVKPPVVSASKCDLALDLIFLMDMSESFKVTEVAAMKLILRAFALDLQISAEKVNVGVLSFGVNVETSKRLLLSSDVGAIIDATMMQTSTGYGTATDLALLAAQSMLEASTRPDAAKAILIITDGQSNEPAKTAAAADVLEKAGIYVVAIGLGSGEVFEKELDTISTSGSDTTILVTTLSSVSLTDLNNKVCPENFKCSYTLQVVYVWDLTDDEQVLADTKKLAADVSVRFADVQAKIIEVKTGSNDIDTLLKGMTEARKETTAMKAYDTIHNIVLITNKPSADVGSDVAALLEITTALKEESVKITIVNARDEEDQGWEQYATSKESVFHGSDFHEAVPAWKFHRSLCKEPCDSGFYIGVDGKCAECPIGTYRDKTTSYTCTACSADSTTSGTASTSRTDCTIKIQCEKPMDLVFVIDATASIGNNYNLLKAYFWSLVDKFPVGLGDNQTRIAVVKIGEDVNEDEDFSLLSESVNSFAVKASIIDLVGNEQSTNTAESLEKVYNIFKTEGRDNTKYPHIVLVATDGRSGNTFQTKRYSSILKLNGIRTLVISLGDGIYQPEIDALAYDSNSIFSFTTYRSLVESTYVPEKICDAAESYKPSRPVVGPELLGECKSYMDMVFVVDASLSVTYPVFLQMKIFMIQFAEMLDIGQDRIRIGVIAFSSTVHSPIFTLNQCTDQKTLETDGILPQVWTSGGTTNTAAALAQMIQMFDTEGRENTPFVAIVMTDGKSDVPASTKLQAQRAKEKGIHIVALGFGTISLGTNVQELYDIATDPASVKAVSTFSELTPKHLLDLSCSFNFECFNEMDIIAVWDLVNFDTIRRAEIFIDGLKTRFLNSVVSNIFVDHVADVALAMREAVQKQKSSSKYNVARVVVVITDNSIDASVKARLEIEANSAKADGILVAVVDAATTSNNIESFASNDKLSFFTNRYDMLPFELVIKRSLCTVPCADGNQVSSATGSCEECEVNKYRDSDESFLCQSCPVGRTTDGATGSDKLSDCLLGNCLAPMDIVFVIDSSQSIRPYEYTLMKVFLINLIEKFDISEDRTRVGLLPYTSDVLSGNVFQLQQSTDPDPVLQAAQDLNQGTLPTGTNTARAIDVAIDMFRIQGRRTGGVTHILVLLTDGMSTNTYKTIEEANKAKEEFIRIFVIGVGPNVFQYELDRVASDEDSKLMVPNFLTLATNTDIISQLCEDSFTCSKTMDVVIFEDRTTADADFQGKIVNFVSKLRSSFSQSTLTLLPYTSMADLSTQVDNQDLSTNPQKTKLFIFVTKTDITEENVKNEVINKLRTAGGIVSVINARSDLQNTNFVAIVTSPQFMFNVENFNELPAYRFLERRFCIEPCSDGEQRGMDGTCEKCPRGTYRIKTDTHICTECADDKTTQNTGSTTASACIPNCGPGFKTVGDNCVECGKGEYQGLSFQSDCETCPAGYSTKETKSISVDQCIKDCNEGERISPSDEDVCIDCEVNTYQPDRAQTECLNCPVNLFSLAGSDSLDDCNDACERNMDIIFLVDASMSLSPISFKLVKVFVENSVFRFKVGLTATRIGIIQFADEVPTDPRLDLIASTDRYTVKNLIRSLVQSTKPGTNTAVAIDAAVNMFDNQGRDDVPKNIIIITDGMSDNTALTVAAAAQAKRRFINIISIGVGTNFFLDELLQIATDETALKTFTSFYSLVTFNILPTVCTPTQFSCDKSMDIFYIKNYDGNADVDSKVTTFIADLKTRYLSSTTVTQVDADINVESLVDDLNHYSDTTNPANTKVIIIFTNKANVDGPTTADVVKDQGVIVAVVYTSDATTDTSYNLVASNENLIFFAENFDQTPYSDFILRSLCIAPCGDGLERARTGDCEQCAKGTYRKAIDSHVCQNCPFTTQQTTTAGPGATDVSQCVACNADEVPCKTGTSVTSDPCIPETKICDGVNDCNDGSDEICNTCLEGYKWTGSICVECEKGTFQDQVEQTECKICPEGSTTDGPGKVSVSQCSVVCDISGQELNYPDEDCRDCEIGYYRDKDLDSVCVKCEDGFITKQTRSTSKDDCVSPCEAGQGWDAQTKACVDCGLGFYQPEPNKINCSSCPAGMTTVTVKSTLATDCQDPCQPGEELSTGSGDCKKCPLNTYKTSQDTTCKFCPPNHVTLETGSTSIDNCLPDCDVGYYFDENLKICQKCTFGTYQDQKYLTSCKPCDIGTTTTTQGNDEKSDCIVPCPAGSYLPFLINGQCTPCPQGTYRVDDETIAECTPCESGKNTDGEGSTSEADCKPDCKPGEKIVGNVCEKCEIGTYQTEPRQITCDTCRDYTSTEQTGADSPDKCVDTCPSGTELIQKNPLVCEKCVMNFYKETGVDENCTPCPANHITLADGATSIRECVPNCENGKRFDSATQQCEDCDIGTFQPEFYKDFCYDCRDKWTTIITGAKTEDDCLPDCEAGEYWDDNTLLCEKCPKDSYQPELYQSNCKKCPTGKFTDAIGAISELQCKDQCPLGEEMGPGGTTPADCIPCKIGTFKDATTSTCQSCDDGLITLDTGKTSSSDCKPPCAAGQRFDSNLKLCVDCEVGTYQEEPNSNTCEPCFPTGYTTLQQGSKLFTDCISPCKPGSAWDNGIEGCKPCWKGKYQDEPNQEECKTCPGTQTTLGDGADSLDDCIDLVCGVDEWQCEDGSCILDIERCDGNLDCPDGSDESNTICCLIGQYFNYSTNQCEACPAGTYQDIAGETACLPCPKGTISSVGADEKADCEECPAGFQLLEGNTVCTDCPVNTYRETGMMTCSPCPPNFISAAGATDLTDCKPDCNAGEYYDSGLLRCEPCWIGYYQDQTGQAVCNRCSTGTTTSQTGSTNSNQCIDICEPGYTLEYDLEGRPTTNCKPCPVSTYKDNSDFFVCKPCAAGFTTADTGSTECLPDCDAGYFYVSKTSTECRLCERGTFQPDRLQPSCIQCPSGQTTPILGATTKFLCYNKCSAGYQYNSATGLCEVCPKGTYRRKEDEGDCKECRTGFTTEGPGTPSKDLCVPDCVEGQYYNRQTSRCEPCPLNSYQSDPYRYVCVQCPAGTAVSSTGSDEMTDCEDPCTVAGEELQPDGSCGPCKVGFAKIPPSTICTECPAGFTTEGPGSSKCVPDCLEGNYWDGTKCAPCINGEYQPNKYQYSCFDCPTGRTTANVGAIQLSQCKDICPDGFELEIDGTCEPCERNYFRSNGVQLQCTPCKKDFITLIEGTESEEDCRPQCDVGTDWNDVIGQCEPCKIGYYQDEIYQKQCKACDSGKTTENIGQTSKDSCVGECEPGTYWYEATSQCLDCAKGTYQSEQNKDFCAPCIPGYTTDFPKSTSQQDCIDKCPSGYTYNAATESCDECGYGKHRDKSKHNICQDCPPGLYTTTETATSEAECISYCVAGSYWSKDKRVCIKCDIGFYQPNPSALQCIPCSDGWITLTTGSTLATQCRPPCVEGEEWDDTSKACVPCPTGKYQDVKYQENCKACEAGKSTQSIRSTKETDCQATTCLQGQWRCLNGIGCVDFEERCNNVPACVDGSDEQGCDCLPGTYFDTTTNQCVNCASGSYQDKGGQLSCNECPVGFNSPEGSDSLSDCEDICESGERYNLLAAPSVSCLVCPQGTYRKKGRDDPLVCIQCPTPFTTENPGAEDLGYCVPKCPKGQYYRVLPNEGCVLCPLGYTQDKEYNQYSCEKCPPGTTTVSSDRSTCTDICGLGEYLPIDGSLASDCKPCEPGYYKDATVYICKKCPNGFTSLSRSDSLNDCYEICEAGEEFIDKTLNTGCKPCDRGYYKETPPTNIDKSCSPCPAGKSTLLFGATSPTLCLDICNDGLELSADRDSCIECPVGKYRAQGSSDTECVPCPTGTTTSTSGSATIDACKRDCGLGHMYDSVSDTCVQCEVGTYQDESLQTTCVACPSWKTTLGSGSTSYNDCIDPCADGYESVNDVCVECERGTYRQQNVQPSCQDCRDQFTTLAARQDTVDKCVPICDRGERWDEDSDSCVPCEAGTYNPVEYQLTCLPCPANRPISSTDFISCEADCPPGEQWNPDRQVCNWCQPGFYKNVGDTVCKICPSGTYSYIMGAASCIPVNCAPGFVRPTAVSNCIQCTGNLVANPTQTECVACTGGLEPSDDNSICVSPGTNWCPGGYRQTVGCNSLCPRGYFRPAGSKQDCQPCPLNYYQPFEGQEQCIACNPPDTTQFTGSTSSADCRADWCDGGFEPKGNPCSPCPAGKYKPEGNAGDCLECELNFYQDLTGQTSCKSCDSGKTTLSKGSTSEDQCRSDWCPGGQQPRPGSSDECEPCPLGRYKPSGQDGPCLECEKNFYQDETGAQGCKSCPKKRPHTMFKGSTSVTKCSAEWCDPGTSYDKDKKECFDCGIGKYRSLDDTGCQDCPSGVTYTLTAESRSECQETCPKGSFINLQTESCELCAKDTYSDTENVLNCTPCEDNGKTKGKGSTGSDMCNENWCPGGYTFDENEQSCVPCGYGRYRRYKLDPQCIDCDNGRSTLTDTASSPDDCIDNGVRSCINGYVFRDGRCRPCPIGTYSYQNSTGCTPCPDGFTTRRSGSYHENLCITMHSACERQFDLIIALDLSNSLTHDASHHIHKHLKYWLKCLIRRLDIHPNRVRVSIVKYARGVSTLIDLHDSHTTENVCSVIDSGLRPSIRLNVNTAGALRKAYDIFKHQGRPGVQKHILLIMDDRSSDPARAADIARYLKDRQVHITVIGPDIEEASQLASSHFSQFLIPSYLRLPLDYNVLRAVCRPRK